MTPATAINAIKFQLEQLIKWLDKQYIADVKERA